MKKGKRLSYVNLRSLNQQLSFGRQLGMNALPGIKRYGDKWQHHLAKAVASGKNVYNGLRVPPNLRRSDADLYLKAAERISAKTPSDRRVDNAELLSHHYQRAATAQSNQFRSNLEARAKLRDHTNRVRRTKNNLRRKQPHAKGLFDTRPPQKIVKKDPKYGSRYDRKFGQYTRNAYKSITSRSEPGISKQSRDFLRDVASKRMRERSAVKAQFAAMEKMKLHTAQFDNRDIGVAIGSSVDAEVTKSDIERLIDRLKRGLPINRQGYLAITQRPELRERIIAAVGGKFYHELFVKNYNNVLYSGNRNVDTRPFVKYFRKGDIGDILKSGDVKDAFYSKVPHTKKIK